MHPTLLIDEVLQAILDVCAAQWDGRDYLWTLCQLARTCKAFSEPALDRLWGRLNGAEPLLALSGCGSSVSDATDSTRDARFAFYASRVKHLRLTIAPSDLPLPLTTVPLPNLRSVSLLHTACLIPASWLASPSLQDIRATLGTIIPSTKTEERCKHFATVLRLRAKTGITKLHIRGWMTPALSDAIVQHRTLRSLALHTGTSLSAQALASLFSLPALEQLSIHAGHIDTSEFVAFLQPAASTKFPALRSLRVRGRQSLLCAILERVPHGTLQSLYFESEDEAQLARDWQHTFALLARKAGDALHDLTLDYLQEPEPQPYMAAAPSYGMDLRLTLETLQPLADLQVLRRFSADAPVLLPRLEDKDIEQLATWWPHLEYLDLGVLDHAATCASNLTVASLGHLARLCPSLQTLTIPIALDICTSGEADSNKSNKQQQSALCTLTVGPAQPDAIGKFVRHVLGLFPRVQAIECTSGDKAHCVDVDVAAHTKDGQDGEVEVEVDALDGFADGQ